MLSEIKQINIMLRDIMANNITLRDIILRNITLRDIMLSDILLSEIMPNDIMLSITFYFYYAECHYTECCGAMFNRHTCLFETRISITAI